MKVFTYNILDGGVGRADPLAEVIEAQDADVIALIEADDAEVVARIARRLGHDVVTAEGYGHSVAILSRWTIVSSINHALLEPGAPRSLLEALIRTPAGADVPIFALHLHARAFEADEQARLRETAVLLRTTHDLRTRNVPHVLMGDFNANSPIQQIDISRCKQTTQEAYRANGNQLPRVVIENLLDHGYVDTLHAHLGDAAATETTFTTHEPGQRVDYVFTYGIDPGRIRRAWVERDRLATFASDHYPVGAEIDV